MEGGGGSVRGSSPGWKGEVEVVAQPTVQQFASVADSSKQEKTLCRPTTSGNYTSLIL
jgi:hypothetical protein